MRFRVTRPESHRQAVAGFRFIQLSLFKKRGAKIVMNATYSGLRTSAWR